MIRLSRLMALTRLTWLPWAAQPENQPVPTQPDPIPPDGLLDDDKAYYFVDDTELLVLTQD